MPRCRVLTALDSSSNVLMVFCHGFELGGRAFELLACSTMRCTSNLSGSSSPSRHPSVISRSSCKCPASMRPESRRPLTLHALGYMFRNIELLDPEEPFEGIPTKPLKAKIPLNLKDPSRMFSRRSFSSYSTWNRTQTVLSQTRRVRTATRNSCMSTMFARCGTYA